MAEIIRFQLRRDTSANWALYNPVLADGEPGIERDTRRQKVGDGITAWNSLPYADVSQSEVLQAIDASAAASSSAAEAGQAAFTAVANKNAAEAARDRAEAVPTTTDGLVKSLLQNPASETATALTATIVDRLKTETPGLNPVSSLPTFIRANGGNPVFTVATQNPAPDALAPTTAASLYWPWIVSAAEMELDNPLDNYYMFYSTDHGAGGIWLATGPNPLGPWTGRGQVYNDTAGGEQTETPTVFRNPLWPSSGKKYIKLYQQGGPVPGAVGAQSTLWAESDNLINWTRGGIALDITPAVHGDGHTGYAYAVTIGQQVFVFHLRGGGDYAAFGLSSSYDGKNFQFVGPLGWGKDQLADGRRIEWNYTSIFRWKGQLLWAGMLSQSVSGVAANDARIGVAPITPNLQSLIGKPQYVLYPPVGDETTSYRCVRVFQFSGVTYLYYQVGNAFYAAIAEA